jgi:hypothetical protein
MSMAQQTAGIVRSICTISRRTVGHMGCCECGVVPHAPSRSGGVYVTGAAVVVDILAAGFILDEGDEAGEVDGDQVLEIEGMA